jgi:hypothetical protein
MVQPMNYTMDVLSPIEGYMDGLKFGEGIQTGRLNRELLQSQEGREQEKFAIAKQDRERSIASAQAAQQNAAAAQAGLVDYVNKLEAGTATPADLRAAMLKFPKMAETFQAFSNSVSAERMNTEITFAKQLAFALKRDPAQAKLLLQERADAAEASGDQKTSAIAKAQMLQIDQNHNAVLTQALMPLVTTMKPDEFDKFYTEVLGIGGDQLALKSSETIGGIASVQIMDDGKTRIVDTRTNTTVTGAAATALLNEAKELNEKPLSGIGKLVFDLNNKIITQDQFDDAVKNLEPSPMVTISQQQEDSFAAEAGKQDAKFFSELNALYAPASRKIKQINRLQDLLDNVETGGGAYVKNVLGRYGIQTEGLNAIQAVSAYIEQLIPGQREPGSGSSSDIDVQGFRRGLPSLINQPGGNKIIVDTIRAIQEHEIAVSIIGGKVMDGELTRSEGRRALNELVHPLTEFNSPTTTPSPIVNGNSGLNFSTMSPEELSQVDVMTLGKADLMAMNARFDELRKSK